MPPIRNTYTSNRFKPTAIMDAIQDTCPELFVDLPPDQRDKYPPGTKVALVTVEFYPQPDNKHHAHTIIVTVPEDTAPAVLARIDGIISTHSHLDMDRNESLAFDAALAAEELRQELKLSPRAFHTFLKQK